MEPSQSLLDKPQRQTRGDEGSQAREGTGRITSKATGGSGVQAPSPFLPGTNIQFARRAIKDTIPFIPETGISRAYAKEIASELIEKAIYDNGCLLCHLAPVTKGYSYLSLEGRKGVKVRVSRLICSVIEGRWLEPHELALHDCDVRRCIHPAHLFVGNAQDNTDDMIAKGRKIDDPNVGQRRRTATGKLIGSALAQGLSPAEINTKYGLSLSTIWNYTGGPYQSSLTFPAGYKHTVCV